MKAYLRWVDADGDMHVTASVIPSDAPLMIDMTRADPLRAGDRVEIMGVLFVVGDPA